VQVEVEDIEDFFAIYGWQFERRSEGLYRTGFVGDFGHYEIWIRVSDAWVYFTISPYYRAPEGETVSDVILALLLRANYDLNLAKFTLDEDGEVQLTVELPREGFAYSHFADALTALSYYADQWRPTFEEAGRKVASEIV
jgi:hypothetical protein